jgi:hypothetical protein
MQVFYAYASVNINVLAFTRRLKVNTSNLKIDDESSDTKQKVFYVSRINPKLPWPTNSALAMFVSGGKFKKFKILTIGDDNVKVVMIK